MRYRYGKFFALLMTMSLLGASAMAGQGGNGQGGGGVTRNGRYMTFYSAGFYTAPTEATSDEVPQLPELINFFNTTNFMSEITKVKYASSLVPSSARKYFRVEANSFTPEVRARLIAEYGRVMKINTNEVALFAITDTTSSTTYLFPEFFSLTSIEQKAILFHEAYWLVNPRAEYGQVIQAEMSFQSYLENPNSSERLLRWLKTSGTIGDALVAAIRIDLQTGALNGLLSNSQIKKKKKQSLGSSPQIALLDLFGPNFFNCKNRGLSTECVPFLNTRAYELSLKYPNSLFIKLYFDSVSRSKLFASVSSNYNSKDNNLLALSNGALGRGDFWLAFSQKSIDLSSIGYSSSTDFPFAISYTVGADYYNFKLCLSLK